MTIFTEENLIAPRPWVRDAACAGKDPDLFFPTSGQQGQEAEAKAVCARCPVAGECLAEALKNREAYGVFGGLNVSERSRLVKGAPVKKRQARVCKMPRCGKKHHARGLCEFHYREVNPKNRQHRPCTVEGCGRSRKARGLCHAHYMKARRAEEAEKRPPRPTVCEIDGCDRGYYAKGKCRNHWRAEQRRNETRPCGRAGCGNKLTGSRGLCQTHYMQVIRAGKEQA